MRDSLVLSVVLSFISLLTNAASVTWSSGKFVDGFTDPNGAQMTDAFAISISFYSDGKGENLVGTDSSGVSSMTGAFSKKNDSIFSSETTYYVKAIVENSNYIRSTDILSFTMPEYGGTSVDFLNGSGLTNPSGGSNTWGEWTEKGGDVPEPTTCSLLLVGLAGMGLKRLRKRRRQQA